MSDRPRLSVELSDEQAERLRKALDWGEQGQLFRKIVDDVCVFIEKYGKVGIACYMTNRLSLLQIMEGENGPKKSKAKHTRDAK